MKIFPPDPLSNEERELATMLARLAPHGVPSPQIDAQILSASHDSVAGPRQRSTRPRWPVVIGLAASMVLAVGVAWQLRPVQPAAGGVESVAADAWSAADAPAGAPAAVRRTQPTPAPAVAAGPPAAELPVAAPDSAAASRPARVVPSARKPAAPASLAKDARPAASAPPQKNLAPPPPRPVGPPAAAAPSVLPNDNVQQSKSLDAAGAPLQEVLRQARMSSARDTVSTAEATAATRRELRVAPASERMQGNASTSEAQPMRARRTDLQVPVAADAQLQVGDWLERVRTRYGLGDEQAARRSLLLFVQDHPTEPVPGDLEPLLDQ